MEQTSKGDNCDSDDLADKLKKLSVYDEISVLFPKVIESLEESGHLDSYLKYNELLASGRLPFDNICYILFPDVIEWFSTENTSKMRYNSHRQCIFHGKFLRFMSGPRSFGQTLDGSREKGCFDSPLSKISFAVPSTKALQSMTPNKTFLPGINADILDDLSKHLKSKPLNLSVDGKKICRGKGKTMGDIDCLGFENRPTLTDRKIKLETDNTLINSVLEQIDKLEGKGLRKANATAFIKRPALNYPFQKYKTPNEVEGCPRDLGPT